MTLRKVLRTVGMVIAIAGLAFAHASLARAQATPTAVPTQTPIPTETPTETPVPTPTAMLPTATPTPFVATNFTSGFANDRLLTLNYPQQFSCPDQFNEDLSYTKDGSGIDIPAQSNPADF